MAISERDVLHQGICCVFDEVIHDIHTLYTCLMLVESVENWGENAVDMGV